ncbi:NTP transferase domain-containing protein [uncultured Sphingomonas sp.]|uniref:NTP transferase domain-containing protein n=1 Tax=uncultured Sphingomonas sp. TaxID=158754 RepID=UPI0035CC9320
MVGARPVSGAGRGAALVLAGKRDGVVDPLAAEAGVTHKCLVGVGGRAMLLHPLAALVAAPEVARIYISIDDPAALDAVPQIAKWRAEGRVVIVAARPNLVDSVVAAADLSGFPLLVTTADNVLLTPAVVAEFGRAARAARADVAVAFATRASVLAAHPDGQRRFYRFRCGSYSNCNLYRLGDERALAAAETFRSGGQFAKHPLRIVGAFGVLNLLRFRFGIGTLAAAFGRFSRRFGLRMTPVVIADGAAAIDVDNPRTLRVAEQVLAAR